MEGVRIMSCINGQQTNGLRYPNTNKPEEMFSRSYYSFHMNNLNTYRRNEDHLYKYQTLYKNNNIDTSRHNIRSSHSNYEYVATKNSEPPHAYRNTSNSRYNHFNNNSICNNMRNSYKCNLTSNNLSNEIKESFNEKEKNASGIRHMRNYISEKDKNVSGIRYMRNYINEKDKDVPAIRYMRNYRPPDPLTPYFENISCLEARRDRFVYRPLPILQQDYLVNPDRFLNNPSIANLIPSAQFIESKICDKLSHDIWMRYLSHKQTDLLFKKKMRLWKQLYTFIKSIFPFYGLFIVGSTMSGFSIESSDVDFCLHVRPTEMDQRIEAVAHLGQLLKFLRRLDIINEIQLIQAKVPILKFQVSDQGLNVDINCNNSVGVRNTHLLYCYSQMDWRVKPLVILIKLWANRHQINDAKNCTISSYSLTLMVLHFLQCGVHPRILPCLQTEFYHKFKCNSNLNQIDFYEEMPPYNSRNQQSLGELFINFLKYYANFEYKLYAISVRTGSKIPINDCKNVNTSKNDPHQWKLLCVEEPFDLTNAARSVYDKDVFQRIKDVFKNSHQILENTKSLESIFV